MSNDKLEKLLVELATDPKLAERYKKNPKGVMEEKGLDSGQIDAVVSGDTATLYKMIDVGPRIIVK